MDESWRMRMGMPTLSARLRASDDFKDGQFGGSESGEMVADDFKDVFGGPPKSVLNKKMSSTYDYLYNEISRRPEVAAAERRRQTGRRLPEFSIPVANRAVEDKARFCKDMVRSPRNCDEQKMKKPASKLWRSMSMSKWKLKSKSKSKSNFSSVLSYEEVRSPIGEDDVALTSIAAKLRPINVPCRWNPTSAMGGNHKNQSPQTSYTMENYYPTKEYIDEHYYTMNSNPNYSQSQQFMGLESPSLGDSRLFCDPEASKQRGEWEEEDEYSSSYVI